MPSKSSTNVPSSLKWTVHLALSSDQSPTIPSVAGVGSVVAVGADVAGVDVVAGSAGLDSLQPVRTMVPIARLNVVFATNLCIGFLVSIMLPTGSLSRPHQKGHSMQDLIDRLAATDQAGSITRGLLFPYLNHAATMFESGYATRADIDASMRFGCGYPIGPLALIDTLGAGNVAKGLDTLFAETGDELHDPVSFLRDPASAEGSDVDEAAPELRHDI